MAKATSPSQKRAVAAHRRRLRRQGLTRLEVHVRKDDAHLIRALAKALADPQREASARAQLRRQVDGGGGLGLKALLAAAPLEDSDLRRDRDHSRDIAL